MAKKRIPKKVNKIINNYLKNLENNGLLVEKAFLFGSYAKGRQHQWSDIDLCVISPKFSEKINPLEYLWQNKGDQEIEAMLSPVGFHPKDFVDESPLAWEIKQHGIRIKFK